MSTAPDDAERRTPRGHPHWGWEFRLEDFVIARLDEDAAAARPRAAAGEAAAALTLARLDVLRHLVAQHSIYVTADGENWARCATCEPTYGVPCLTLQALSAYWPDRPDHPYPGLTLEPRNPDLVAAGSYRRLRWPDTTRPPTT